MTAIKKLIFTEKGDARKVLQLSKVPAPQPKEDEVVIAVTARPINPSDLVFVEGNYGFQPELPSGAGFEGAGTLKALGAAVKGLKIGQKVSFSGIGTWSEEIAVPANAVIPVPDALPDQIAAQLFVNPFSAYAILDEAQLKEGDWLLLTAGGSTFSQLVVQLAAERGIKPICLVRSDKQNTQLAQLGAAAVVNQSKGDFVKEVLKLTNGKGVKACMDAVGGELTLGLIQCSAPGGKILPYGMLSMEAGQFHNGLVLFKSLTIKGFWLSTWIRFASPEKKAAMATDLITRLANGSLKLEVEAAYPLEDFAAAIDHAMASGRKGKILLV